MQTFVQQILISCLIEYLSDTYIWCLELALRDISACNGNTSRDELEMEKNNIYSRENYLNFICRKLLYLSDWDFSVLFCLYLLCRCFFFPFFHFVPFQCLSFDFAGNFLQIFYLMRLLIKIILIKMKESTYEVNLIRLFLF